MRSDEVGYGSKKVVGGTRISRSMAAIQRKSDIGSEKIEEKCKYWWQEEGLVAKLSHKSTATGLLRTFQRLEPPVLIVRLLMLCGAGGGTEISGGCDCGCVPDLVTTSIRSTAES